MRRKLIAALIVSASLTATAQAFAKAQDDDLLAPHSAYIKGRLQCLETHSHVGGADGRTKRLALRAAIREWQSFTAWEYGSAWASYRRAAGKSVEYIKAEVGWTARVEARPCRRIKLRRKRRSRRS